MLGGLGRFVYFKHGIYEIEIEGFYKKYIFLNILGARDPCTPRLGSGPLTFLPVLLLQYFLFYPA